MEPEQDKKKINHFKVLIYSAIISFVVFMIILFVIPYTVNNWVINSVGNNDSSLAGSWISFWGSFLGGIVGMLAVVLTTHFLIMNQNKHHNEQLEEQRKAITDSALLQDQIERERIILQFELNQMEESFNLLNDLDKFLNLYKTNVYRVLEFLNKIVTSKVEYEISNDLDSTSLEILSNSYKEETGKFNIYSEKNIEIIIEMNTILHTLSVMSVANRLDIEKLKEYFKSNMDSITNGIYDRQIEIYSILSNEKDKNIMKDKISEILKNRKVIDDEKDEIIGKLKTKLSESRNELFTLKLELMNKFKTKNTKST